MKETTVTLNKKEVELIKTAIESYKVSVTIKSSSQNIQRRELAINEMYNIEKIEEKLKNAKD
jgi:hypothetical protein